MRNNISPIELYAELLNSNLSTRRRRSLEIINNVCKEQHDLGSKDFSIPTIGRLVQKVGGPSDRTIRNKEGEIYRSLMNAWANYSDGTTKKPKASKERSINDDILEGISDPTIRALVGIIMAENRKLKGENSLLKRSATLNIDMRLENQATLCSGRNVEVLTSAPSLLPSEVQALEHAISEDNLKDNGWVADDKGRIKHKGRTIFKIGFVSGIKKIVEHLNS